MRTSKLATKITIPLIPPLVYTLLLYHLILFFLLCLLLLLMGMFHDKQRMGVNCLGMVFSCTVFSSLACVHSRGVSGQGRQ